MRTKWFSGSSQITRERRRPANGSVRFARKRGWSQEELAHRSGLARSFTGAIERGEKDIRLSTLLKLAKTFNLTLQQLIKNTGP